jgi:hypothetical protein
MKRILVPTQSGSDWQRHTAPKLVLAWCEGEPGFAQQDLPGDPGILSNLI